MVQRFEFTFELCWKMLRRRLQMDAADSDAVGRMSYSELIRLASARGYIADAAS